jgi:hypothetical protein
MIRGRVADVIECFARDRNDMRLANFQRVRGLDAEWKLLRCPTEYCLPNLTPLWANRNLGANRSQAFASDSVPDPEGVTLLMLSDRPDSK